MSTDHNDIDAMDLRMVKLLNESFGHKRSRSTKASVDQNGQPIPWYTYPALEFVDDLSFAGKRIFEFGSGNSTIYWARRCEEIVAVEHDPDWHAKIADAMPANATLLHRPNEADFIAQIERHGLFDVVIIDSPNWRWACARIAGRFLRPGGLIILDNSDWYVKAAEELSGQGYLQVDMKGFGPINPYTWVTSFFFDRAFDFPKRHRIRPTHGRGGRTVLAAEEWDGIPPDPMAFIDSHAR
jgi:Methyltransferase domain